MWHGSILCVLDASNPFGSGITDVLAKRYGKIVNLADSEYEDDKAVNLALSREYDPEFLPALDDFVLKLKGTPAVFFDRHVRLGWIWALARSFQYFGKEEFNVPQVIFGHYQHIDGGLFMHEVWDGIIVAAGTKYVA